MTRRFHTLDGIRGIAALAVTVGHYAHWFEPLQPPHGWLAVDLFFVMSGVVISQVYEPRFRHGMATSTFIIQRYIRFYPLFILGVLIGLLSELATIISGHGTMTFGAIFLSFITSSAMLPSPTWHLKSSIMPLNEPGWSLFFELFINIIFVIFWRFWNIKTISSVIFISGSAILFHFFDAGAGFGGSTWATFFWGFPRVSFSFFLGILIARHGLGKTVQSHWAWLPLVALIPIFFFDHGRPDYVDIAIQFFLFPAIVFASVRIEPRSTAIMEWLGRISYPLYAIHIPILFIFWRILIALHLKPEDFSPFIGIVVLIFVVTLASWLDRSYDQPSRSWLMKWTFKAKSKAATQQSKTNTLTTLK